MTVSHPNTTVRISNLTPHSEVFTDTTDNLHRALRFHVEESDHQQRTGYSFCRIGHYVKFPDSVYSQIILISLILAQQHMPYQCCYKASHEKFKSVKINFSHCTKLWGLNFFVSTEVKVESWKKQKIQTLSDVALHHWVNSPPHFKALQRLHAKCQAVKDSSCTPGPFKMKAL